MKQKFEYNSSLVFDRNNMEDIMFTIDIMAKEGWEFIQALNIKGDMVMLFYRRPVEV